MRKKAITITLILATLIMVIGCVGFNIATNNQNTLALNKVTTFENASVANWEEVPIRDVSDGIITARSARSEFDLKAIITGDIGGNYNFNTYVFSGTVVNRKEFEVSWTDDKGEQWGPFSRSILEVKVHKEYHGKSPVEGDIIKVLYPYSLSDVFSDSVYIEDDSEYVFVNCWVLDETYTDYVARYNPDSINDDSVKHADVIMGGAWNSLFPINDGKVMLYHGYFDHDEEAKKKILPSDFVKMNKLTSDDSLELGDFITLNMADFEKAFLKLFENPDLLPTVEQKTIN